MAKTLFFSKNKQFFYQKGAKMGHEYTITIAQKTKHGHETSTDWQKIAKNGQKHHYVTTSNVF